MQGVNYDYNMPQMMMYNEQVPKNIRRNNIKNICFI